MGVMWHIRAEGRHHAWERELKSHGPEQAGSCPMIPSHLYFVLDFVAVNDWFALQCREVSPAALIEPANTLP